MKQEGSNEGMPPKPAILILMGLLGGHLGCTTSMVLGNDREQTPDTFGPADAGADRSARELAKELPGDWDIVNENIEGLISVGHAFTPSGRLRVLENGDFEMLAGSFSAIDVSSVDVIDRTKTRHVDFPLSNVARFSFSHYMDETQRTSNPRSVIPTLLDVRPDRVVFSGSNQSISFLRRVSGPLAATLVAGPEEPAWSRARSCAFRPTT